MFQIMGLNHFPCKLHDTVFREKILQTKEETTAAKGKQFEVSVICSSPQGLVNLCLKDRQNPVQ